MSDIDRAVASIQHTIVDELCEILETGLGVNRLGRATHGYTSPYRDEAQAERVRRLRDRLNPDCDWAKSRYRRLPLFAKPEAEHG